MPFRILYVALLFLVTIPPLIATSATPVSLRDITVTPGSNSATITFLVSASVKTVVIEPKGSDVAQVRMKSLAADSKALNSALPKPGVVSVKAHIERTDVLVTNVQFARKVKSMSVISRNEEKIVVRVTLGDKVSGSNAADPDRWDLSTIVIDAGHGGKDPGASGRNGEREKDVTLAVAKLLKSELKSRMRDVKIIMTREDDTFVELYRRGEIANRNKGGLFVSIHCNAMPEGKEDINGFECWILRPGKSEAAAEVASRENKAIQYESRQNQYDTLDAERAILGTLAQSTFARKSEELAQSIRKMLQKKTPMKDRGLHQAGFYVLVGASMPAVLVELGYLSNSTDAKNLTSSSVQKKIAKAIADGVVNYQKKQRD